jgi:hypothetical protein
MAGTAAEVCHWRESGREVDFVVRTGKRVAPIEVKSGASQGTIQNAATLLTLFSSATIHRADGTRLVKEVRPKEGAVVLEPDVRRYFPDSDSVNTTLRSLIQLIPRKHTKAGKRREP